jgi:hypothetical protein
VKACKDDLIDRFGKIFELEKRKRRRYMLRKSKSKPGLSNNSLGHLKQRYNSAASHDSTTLSSIAGRMLRNPEAGPRPIPGNLYWKKSGQAICSRYRGWGWYHTKCSQVKDRVAGWRVKERVATWPVVVGCTPSYDRTKQAVAPRYHKFRDFFRTDPETGRDVFQKIAGHLEVTTFGHTSSGPMLILIGMIVIAAVAASWHAILIRILLEII